MFVCAIRNNRQFQVFLFVSLIRDGCQRVHSVSSHVVPSDLFCGSFRACTSIFRTPQIIKHLQENESNNRNKQQQQRKNQHELNEKWIETYEWKFDGFSCVMYSFREWFADFTWIWNLSNGCEWNIIFKLIQTVDK